MKYSRKAQRSAQKIETNNIYNLGTHVFFCVLFSVVPIACFYLMESYDRNPFIQLRSAAHWLNIILFELLAWIIWFLLKSEKWAMRMVILLSALAGLVNHYVTEFRSTPFVPWDIYSLGTAASVVGEYDFTPNVRVVVVVLLFTVLFVLAGLVKYNLNLTLAKRLPAAGIICLLLSLFVGRLQTENFQNACNLYPFLFTPGVMVKYNGFAVTFTMDLAYMQIDKPSGYNRKETETLYASYEEQAEIDKENYLAEVPESEMPNIIVIMDEAFSDLQVLGDFETNVDYMPFVHSLQEGRENTITGYLKVSVCGGNTANTEFEFLTGNTMTYLPGGSIPYQQYIRSEIPNLTSWLRSLGYETYAQHPYSATGWQRNKVYPLLGFDDLDFIDSYRSVKRVREYVSDESDFDHILNTLTGRQSDGPAFIFNVTMQNHGGYSDTYSNFSNQVNAVGLDNNALDQYLSLIRLSDKALEEFLSELEVFEEKTIVVFFGDHQPNNSVARSVLAENGMDYRYLTDEQEALRYQVPYVIWANYDIREGMNEDTAASFLGSHLMEAAGLPMSAYQRFLTEEESTGSCLEDEMYQKLQYYLLFDE